MIETMLVANADTPVGRAVRWAASEAGYAIVEENGAEAIHVLFVAPRARHAHDGPIEALPPQDFVTLVESDLGATARLLRAALPRLVAVQGCIILSTYDCATGPADAIAHTVSAEATATLAKSITYQYGPLGVRANAIAMPSGGDAATPDDVASLVLFLASPDASYMTGAVLPAGSPKGR